MTALPDGWRRTTLGETATVIRNGLFASRPTGDATGTRILRISAVRHGRVDLTDSKHVPGLTAEQIQKYSLQAGDLLFTRYNGSRALVGISGLVPRSAEPVIHPDKLIRVQLPRDVDARFVNFQMKAAFSRAHIESRIKTTAGQSGISGADLRATPLLLPELREQWRIVDILEDHLSRLDAASAYRQSAQQRTKVMTRSLASRHFSGHGEVPLATLLESSIGGVWGSAPGVDDVDVDVLRVTELRERGKLDPTTAARRSVTASQLSSRELRAGDLLLEKSGGGPRQPVGRVGIVAGLNRRSVCSNFMQLMRPDAAIANPRFLHLYLNHLHDRGGTLPLQKASTNIRNLKASEYLQLPVPRPDLPTQHAVVAVLTRHEEALDRLAVSNDALARREESLRRALLIAAFSGRLTGRASDMDRVEELAAAGAAS